MSELPYFPFYPSNYLAKTQHLTCEQHGLYFQLLMASWPNGGGAAERPPCTFLRLRV